MSNSSPSIGVVIFTYNSEKYLRESIESVLDQTLRPHEILICDDHSTDNTWSIASEYRQRYPDLIRIHRQRENMGQERNGNFGKKNVQGDLFAYIDGDDRWLPRKLELEWEALQRCPGAQAGYSNVYTIDSEGDHTSIWYDGSGSVPPSGDIFVETFSRRIFPNTRSVFRNQLMYRSAFEKVGYNDLSLDSYWDWDEKIRLTWLFPVAYSGEALVEYRQHKGSFSRREPEKHFSAMIQVYEKNLPLLAERPTSDSVRVRCNIESMLALKQRRLPTSEQIDRYSVRRVYERNGALFGELPAQDRRELQEEVHSLLRDLLYWLATEAAEEKSHRQALRYLSRYLRCNPEKPGLRWMMRLMSPPWFYSLLGGDRSPSLQSS